MSETDDQLGYVRGRLDALPRNDWHDVAMQAGVSPRTLYNVMNPAASPAYNTVHNLFTVLRSSDRRGSKAKRGVK